MKILFVHQNFPGQFKNLCLYLGRSDAHDIRFLSRPNGNRLRGINLIHYDLHRKPNPNTHWYLRMTENAVLHGQAVASKAMALRNSGWRPDIIFGHAGWGEMLFLKDVWPDVPVINYCEFFYRAFGADMHFDPNDKPDINRITRLRTNNALHLLSLDAADRGICPTYWQRQQYPVEYHDKIDVVFDGVDTTQCQPNPNATFALPDGRVLQKSDEVITYVARGLEPYRGFITFMRALPEICRRRPNADVLIVGGDEVSYGSPPPGGKSWREVMLEEVKIDSKRVHFLGKLPYDRFLDLLKISSVHVYLTYPWVLSWSFMEAMACECLIVGSDTPPVREVLEDGVNGLMVDFWSTTDVADKIDAVLDHPTRMQELRRRARQTVLERYDLKDCLPRTLQIMEDMAGRWARAAGTRLLVPAEKALAG